MEIETGGVATQPGPYGSAGEERGEAGQTVQLEPTHQRA